MVALSRDVEAIGELVAALPSDVDAALFVVLPIGTHRSELPFLLNQSRHLPASHAADGEPIGRGHIDVAPPDHHMVLEQGVIRLTRGPREFWARPAMDPLFRSAARSYGSNVIGIILTGGLTIVQDPDDAADPDMPRSALQHVAIDHRLPLHEIAPPLTKLVAGTRPAIALSGTGFVSVEAGSEDRTADYGPA